MRLIHQTLACFTILLLIGLQDVIGQIVTEIKVDQCSLPRRKKIKLNIQQIIIQDTFLVQQIDLFIKEQIEKDSIFRSGQGYMKVFPHQDLEHNIIHRYYINNEYHGLNDEDNDKIFPPFYSYVGGRLVFIYMPLWDGMICYYYDKRSKRVLKRKLEPFMPQSRKVVERDKSGKVVFRDKHFRMEWRKSHGGKYIYIYSGDKPPKVMPELPGLLLDPDKPIPKLAD